MKKLLICAAFIASMGVFTTANAQDCKQKKCTKSEVCEKKCTKECKNTDCAKAECKDCKCAKKECKKSDCSKSKSTEKK